MIKILDFEQKHIENAQKIAMMNYNEERELVPALPYLDKSPSLEYFARNNLGVVAMDGDELLGFFCWFKPRDNHFGLCKGTCSLIDAHGAVKQNRADIYDRMYQLVAKRLVADGVFTHFVQLYEHDKDANDSFFQNGFGRRCVDAIRMTDPIIAQSHKGIIFRQATEEDAEAITEMRNNTSIHLSQSPMFMPYSKLNTADETIDEIKNRKRNYFIALEKNRPIALLRIQEAGENFVCDDPSMMNITGAYTIPEFRGKGIAEGLLSWLMDWLRDRGYERCGVDFESFNFTARKFWSKYFTSYTNGAVRRIDERIDKYNL